MTLEWALGLAVLLSLWGLYRSFQSEGYLPSPFLYSKSDTFMDWYNPAYWAHKAGTYSEWQSVYPPFSFLFQELFSRPSCYPMTAEYARDCDPVGWLLITALIFVNTAIALAIFWRNDRATALPRALALGLGMPALYGWERGNVVIAAFTAFMLAYSNLIRSGWIKAALAAVTVNFKPYLLVAAVDRGLRRDWLWLEWFGLFLVGIYALSFALFGSGGPLTVIHDVLSFTYSPDDKITWDIIEFPTTYTGLEKVLTSQLPLLAFIPSRPLEIAQAAIPLAIRLGEAGVAASLAYAFLRPHVITRWRMQGLVMLALLSVSQAPGGYAPLFPFFFVFLERRGGPWVASAVVLTYVYCLWIDYPLTTLTRDPGYSFLSQHSVSLHRDLTIGQLARPGLLLIAEYCLIAASLTAAVKDMWSLRPALFGLPVAAEALEAPPGATPQGS